MINFECIYDRYQIDLSRILQNDFTETPTFFQFSIFSRLFFISEMGGAGSKLEQRAMQSLTSIVVCVFLF